VTLWYVPDPDSGTFSAQPVDLDRNPCPTVMAGGISGRGITQYWLENDGMPRVMVEASSGLIDGERVGTLRHAFIDATDRPMPSIIAGRSVTMLVDRKDIPFRRKRGPDKPPYRVPSMADIRAFPWNGLTVASTFAGGGGSSTGYRMAGCKVVWANEVVPIARRSYAANMDPSTILDGTDIRQVTAEDILKATGLKQGMLDIFDGSPPCVSFSTAGKREQGWGRVTASHDITQRHDDLFYEFARLLKGLQPRVFVAENVSGLIKGTAKGYFLEILRALRACGYRVEAKLLDAQWLGVPQMRQRIIFMGVRNDLPSKPAFPAPLAWRYTVRDALPWLGGEAVAIHDTNGWERFSQGDITDAPSPAVMTSAASHYVERRVVHDTRGRGGAEGFNSWSSGDVTDHPCPTITNGTAGLNSSHFRVVHDTSGQYGAGDVTDRPSPSVLSGRSGTHQVLRTGGLELPPSRDKAYDGKDAYGIQIADADKPSPTVTLGSPGNDLGHPTERRKFTIAELKRICSFPDDYVLEGSYADQWARCGNAVPPVMMFHIARTIRDNVLK